MGKRKKSKTLFVKNIPVREIRTNYFMVDFRREGKSRRRCFESMEEATAYCKQLSAEIKNKGLDVFRLTDNQRMDAMKALEILSGSVTLTGAATEYVRRHPIKGGEIVLKTCAKYLRQMRVDGCRPISIREKRGKFKALCRDYGHQVTAGVDVSDIERWINQHGYSGTTAHNYAGAFKSLLAYSRGEKPAKRRIDQKMPSVWKAPIVTKLFAVAEAEHPEIIPAFTALFFCGLRPHEMMRLNWSNINLDEGNIRIEPEQTKIRTARIVEINSTAMAWFKSHPGTGALIKSEKTYRAARESVMKLAKIDAWPKDVSRHTYASMFYAHTDNVAKVMAQLGHFESAQMFVQHYKSTVTKKESATYWQIMPHVESNAPA